MIPRKALKSIEKRMGRIPDFRHMEREKVFELGRDNKGVYYLNAENEILPHEEWTAIPVQTLKDEGEFYYDLGYYLRA